MGWQNSILAQLPVFRSFTIQDGLAGNPVKKIFQDSKGFIWLCTWDGLSKYDGQGFTNFSTANGFSHDLVNDICETPEGKLFVALNNGMTYKIINDRILQNPVIKDTTIESFIHGKDGELLAITTLNGIMKLADGKLQPLSSPIMLSGGSLLAIEDSLFLASSPDNVVPLHLLNSKFEITCKYPNPASIYSLFQDLHRHIWAGCEDGLKQIIIDPKNRRISLATPPPPFQDSVLKNGRIRCIWEDDQQNLWIGTTTGLVLVEKNGSIQKFTKADGLPDEHIYCLFEDKEKNIWIGTGQGVARLVNRGRKKYWSTRNGLLGEVIYSIVKVGDQYLIGEKGGIQRFNQAYNELTTLKVPFSGDFGLENVQSSTFTLLSTSSNSITRNIGIIDLKNNMVSEAFKFVVPDGTQFYCWDVSNKNTFVIGTRNALRILYNGKVKVDSTISGLITCLFIDDSILWVGTHSKGLYRIRFQEMEDVKLSNHTRISLPDSMIRSIYKDKKGILWIGTRYNGVYNLIEEKNGLYHVEQIDKRHGLISNWVKVITEDKNHNIWIGSNTGVDKLLENKKGWRIFNFSRFNNLFGSVNTILPDDNGSIWIGMNNGLANVPDAGYDTLPPMPVYITRIQTHLKVDSIIIPVEHSTLSLPYSDNAISFNFTSPGFINEKEMKYSFRLVSDRDTAWSTPTSLPSVSYASLQPGTYRFEVKNLGWNGVWGNSTSYSFTILSPFWKTWWFILVIAAAVAFILYLLYRYRIDQLKKIQLVRNRIATDLHDDIGSALTNISILTELSKRNRQEPEKAEAYIDRIREEIDTSGQALDDIIWSVNTKNDTLHETAARMRRYASELFDARNIRYDLKMDPQISDKKISMEQRRDLFLIFKEILNNIHKHASPTSVNIVLFIEKQTLNLVINDNGVGFDTTRLTNRNGISNIKTRVGRWKGTVNLHSQTGIGTSINILLPLSGITQKRE